MWSIQNRGFDFKLQSLDHQKSEAEAEAKFEKVAEDNKPAQNKETKHRVAIKIYPKYKLNDASKKNAVKREIACMKKLNHPYVCKLYDHFESSKELYLV